MIALATFIKYFVIQPSEADGRSMETTYHDGDLIIVDKLSLLFRSPARGDVVSFFGPYPKTLTIKRVIGLPGEQVSLEKGKVIITKNDGTRVELSESYLGVETVTIPETGYKMTYPVLKENEYFLLGDNREHSDDSRVFGPISRTRIIGLVR